jgi:hypothetical protein
MPQCPQCGKRLAELARKCPSCMADLDLLVEYVSQLQTGLERAETLTRAGDLDAAVWAYLAVLEVDPDNPSARRQVGRVATAVRQFDRTVPGRRWLAGVRGERVEEDSRLSWLGRVAVGLLLLGLAFGAGFVVGNRPGGESPPGDLPPPPKIDHRHAGPQR